MKLFRKTFRFIGGEITGAFPMSAGYLPGTHSPECPVHAVIAVRNPSWLQAPDGIWGD